MKKWMYLGNLGLLAKDHEIDQLKDYFTQTAPDDFLKFEEIHFGKAIAMVNEAKEKVLIEEMKEQSKEQKKQKKK
jgi:hypothetical protein